MTIGITNSVADVHVARPLKSRKIIVFARDANDADLKRQFSMLAKAKVGLSDRDVVLQEVIGTHSQSEEIHRKFGFASGFHVLLFGRDGQIADSSDHPWLPQKLFQIIDAMPMRQQEMRKASLNHAPQR